MGRLGCTAQGHHPAMSQCLLAKQEDTLKWTENSDSKDKSISLRSCEDGGQISCSLTHQEANCCKGDTTETKRVISSSGIWFSERRWPILSLRATNRHELARIQSADAHSSDTGCASLQPLWGANVMGNMHSGMATMGPDASALCPPGRLSPIRAGRSYSPQDSREVWLRLREASATPRPSDAGAAEGDDDEWTRIDA